MKILEKVKALVEKYTEYVLVRRTDIQKLVTAYEGMVASSDPVKTAVLQATVEGLELQLEMVTAQRALLEQYSEEASHALQQLYAEISSDEHLRGGTHMERNHLVVLVAHMANLLGWNAGVGVHEGDAIEGFTEVVRIDTPVGQLSWHIHDTQRGWLEQLPPYEGRWDGTTSEKKYALIRSLFGRV
jgi:hypothetical protein